MAESEVILDGFYPLVTLGRFFGCFSFTNIGQVKSTSELGVRIFTINVLATFLIVASALFCFINVVTYGDDFGNFTDSVISSMVVVYQVFGMATVVHVNVKSRAIVDYLRHWSRVQHLLRCRKFVKHLGYSITLFVIIIGTSYVALHLTYYDTPWTVVRVFRVFSLVISTSLGLYFGGLIVYFNKALQCCFAALELELIECLALENCWKTKLAVIRQRHELLVGLSQRFNSILSPVLVCFVVIQSTSSCVSFYEAVDLTVAKSSSTLFPAFRSVSIGTIRFIPVIAICVSGQMINHQASSAIRHLASHQMLRVTADSKFQIEMLRFQFQARIPHISADGFLEVNNRLLGEIIGVMATYIVIMLEVSQGRLH